MPLSNELIQNLNEIMKRDYGADLTDDEAKIIGEQLVASYEALIRLNES